MKKGLSFNKRGTVKRKLAIINGVSVDNMPIDDMIYELDDTGDERIKKLTVKKQRLMTSFLNRY